MACAACCTVISAEEGATGCEFHEGKVAAQKERNAAKRAQANAKKAKAKEEGKKKGKGKGSKAVGDGVAEGEVPAE